MTGYGWLGHTFLKVTVFNVFNTGSMDVQIS